MLTSRFLPLTDLARTTFYGPGLGSGGIATKTRYSDAGEEVGERIGGEGRGEKRKE